MKKLLFLLLLATPALAQTTPDTLVFNPRRAVTLQGSSNFRDLGGYPAAGGKRVKWGHIYRSADISKLTDSDLQALQSRHVALVCDLRGPQEVAQAPDRMPPGARRVELPAGSEKIDPRALLSGGKNINRDSLMRAVYTNLRFFHLPTMMPFGANRPAAAISPIPATRRYGRDSLALGSSALPAS